MQDSHEGFQVRRLDYPSTPIPDLGHVPNTIHTPFKNGIVRFVASRGGGGGGCSSVWVGCGSRVGVGRVCGNIAWARAQFEAFVQDLG